MLIKKEKLKITTPNHDENEILKKIQKHYTKLPLIAQKEELQLTLMPILFTFDYQKFQN